MRDRAISAKRDGRADRVLSRLYGAAGALTALFFLSYLVKLLLYPEGTLAYVIAAGVPLAVIVPVLLRRPLRRLLGRAYLWLKGLMAAGMCFYLLTFGTLCACLLGAAWPAADTAVLPPNAAVLVFGARVYENGPGATTALRLDAAAELLQRYPDAICVVSGGRGKDEPASEAEIMADYLAAKGVVRSRILEERCAADTRQNIMFSRELLGREGQGGRTLVCVSNRFHLARIRLMCRRAGLEAVYCAAPDTAGPTLFTALVREYLSWAHFLLLGW